MKYPDYVNYDHSIVGLSNSLLSAYGVQPFHKTLPAADNALKNNHRNVVLLVLDGLGMDTLERQLSKNSFLRLNLKESYSSVFPPTTTAATVSLLSGLTPAEHGWLACDMYFPEYDRNISLFPNTFSGTMELASKISAAWRRFPYLSILERIKEKGIPTYSSAGHEQPYPNSFKEVLERTARLCSLPHKKVVYAYYEHPDGMQHWKGCYSRECKEELERIDRQVQAFCEEVEDTLLLITAVHGHIDIHGRSLALHPEIRECLYRPFSMEARRAISS